MKAEDENSSYLDGVAELVEGAEVDEADVEPPPSVYEEPCTSEMFPLHGLLSMYRPMTDVVTSVIVNSKSEGVSKYEIGKHLGLNVHVKSGARKVAQAVQVASRLFPNEIDQFQKMTGRFRCIHYFLKDSVPANLVDMVQRFEELAGVKCPFSFGQIIKFPNTGLNTLRVSDVTFQRFIYILGLLKEREVIVPSHQIIRFIHTKEQETGYLFSIDKKSVMKCLIAMQKNGLCRILTGEHDIDGVTYELEAVTVPAIRSFTDPRIHEAIEKSRVEYGEQDRAFPSGIPIKPKAKDEEGGREEEEGMEPAEKKKRRSKRAEKSPEGRKATRSRRAPREFSSAAMEILTEKMDLPVLTNKTVDTLRATAVARRRRRTEDVASGSGTKRFKASTSGGQEMSQDTEQRRKKRGGRKRSLDETDLMSRQRSVYVRSRFTPRERDMVRTLRQAKSSLSSNCKSILKLVLIRAVGAFLNPIRRLWIDASIIRDIMHVYFEESRSKTVNSLLAASARDLVRNNRRDDLEHIVKTLASYKEMRKLRSQIASVNLHEPEEVRPFFTSAFDTAYKLIFREEPGFPTIHETDEEFQKYLAANDMSYPPYEDTTSSFPLRSRKATDLHGIQHSLVYNLIMSILLNDAFKRDGSESGAALIDSLVKNINAGVMAEVLSAMHADNLISRSRISGTLPPSSSIKEEKSRQGDQDCEEQQEQDEVTFHPKQTICSTYYRSFFAHKYVSDLTQCITEGTELLQRQDTKKISEADEIGPFLLLSDYLAFKEKKLSVEVPEQFDAIFATAEQLHPESTSTKQLRHLEKADLQVQHIEIHPSKIEPPTSDFNDVNELERRFPSAALASREATVNTAKKGKIQREICDFIRNSGVVGVTQREISIALGIDQEKLVSVLSKLEATYAIFPCGVDERRYVTKENIHCWLVQNADSSFVPKPWIQPSGEVNFPVLRWMAESVLVAVTSKPGITLVDVNKAYSVVLQPSLVMELVELLEKIGSLRLVTKQMTPMVKASPFQRNPPPETVRYLMPARDALEKFASFAAHKRQGAAK